MRRKKINSISYKISFVIMITLLVSSITLSFINLQNASHYIDQEATSSLLAKVALASNRIEKELFDAEAIVNTLASSIKTNYSFSAAASTKVITELLIDSAAAYPSLQGIFYIEHFNNENANEYRVVRGADGDLLLNISSPRYFKEDVRENMEWYTLPYATGKSLWTKTYQRDQASPELVSYVVPVFSNQELLGIAGIDIPISYFSANLENITSYQTGYAFLLDADFQIMVHPNHDSKESIYTVEDGNLASLGEAFTTEEHGSYEYTYQRQEKILSYNTLHNGWILGIAPLQSEVFASNEQNQTAVLFFLGIMLLLSIVVSLALGQHISRPLYTLYEDLQAFKKNAHITHRDNLLRRKDEIGLLSKELIAFEEESCQKDAKTEELLKALEERIVKQSEYADEKNRALAKLLKEQKEKSIEVDLLHDQLVNSIQKVKKAEAQLMESQKLASLGSFVAGVAHEINTPLGISLTSLSYLAKETQETRKLFEDQSLSKADLRRFLLDVTQTNELLVSNLTRAERMIRNFKHMTVNQLNTEPHYFNLRNIVDAVLMSLTHEYKKKNITFKVQVDPDLSIYGRADEYTQIFTNLIRNSLLHGFTQHEEGKIEIMAKKSGQQILITYLDNGNGIPKEHLDKIYQPFFTTARQSGGSGIGLNVIYNAVTTNLGGSIQVESTEGYGVQFTIKVPLQDQKNIN